MRWVNEERLGELLSHIRGNSFSSFYDTKYAGLTIDTEHFFELPPLTRAELQNTPLSERTFVSQGDVRFAAFTSGTSSKQPLITLFSEVERYFVEPSLGMGVSRPLIIYPPLNKNFGHTFIQQCREASVPVSPMFADFQNLQNSALVAKATKCDSIYATPTIAALFAPYAAAQGIASEIKLLALSSETLTEARRAELMRLYPHAKIANLYASSEIGQFAMWPCKTMIEAGANAVHVASDALAAVELVNGELVVSYGLNRACPLVRYKTGDSFEEALPCNCGTVGPTLRWSHRSEVDRFRLNGVEFDVEEADRTFSRLSRPTSRYQVHFNETAQGGVALVVEIEDKESLQSSQKDMLERALASELVDSWHISGAAVLRDALARGLFASCEVRFVEALSEQSLKTKRFINHVR